MKRILSSLLFALISITSWGYANGDIITSVLPSGEGFTFQIMSAADKTLRVWSCSLISDITIPYEVVDSVGTRFYVKSTGVGTENRRPYKANISGTLTVSEGITSIEGVCFRPHNITKFVFPSTLSWIGDSRLSQSYGLLYQIEINENNPTYKSIENHAFVIRKSDNVLMFATNCDADGVKKKKIVIPEGVTTVSSTISISGNGELEEVEFPKSWKSFTSNPRYLFNSCPKFNYCRVNADNPYFKDINGVVYSKDGKTLVKVPYRLKDSEFDWSHCVAGNFGTFTIPDNVETIGPSAFAECQMGTIVIPSAVTTISHEAFAGCSRLKTVSIGSGVTSIVSSSFSSCSSLTAINIDDDNPIYKSVDGIMYNKDMSKLLTCPAAKSGSFKVPDETKTIASQALYGCHITSIDFNNVTTLEASAVGGCHIKDVYLGPNIETVQGSVGGTSFTETIRIGKALKTLNANWQNYPKIKEITFEEGCQLETLPTFCFRSGVYTSITIPKSIKTIGKEAFTTNLTELKFEEGSQLKKLDTDALSNLINLESIDMGGCTQITTIGTNAFRNMVKLNTISIPTSVTSIGTSAFNGCTDLKTVNFGTGSSIKTIGANAFQNTGLESISLPDNLVTLQNEAFTNCHKLKTVNIPATTTAIGAQAFLFCSGLNEINVAEGNTKYATTDGMLCSKDKKTLLSFPAGRARESFTLLSPSIEAIGDSAFFYCKKLKNITIPKHVSRIGNYAFYLCDNLNSITFLTDGPVSNLGNYAFGTVKNNADGSQTITGDADFLHNNVTINIRKNGRQGEYSADGSVWKNCEKAYSFKNTGDVNEYLPMSTTSVNLLSCTSDKNSVVIPAKVKNSETGTEYSVAMISDYAFEDINGNVKEIILRGPVEYVGSCAFYNKATGKSSIESIFFTDYQNVGDNELSTERFGLDANYKEFLSTQKIYVPKSKQDAYKTSWPTFASQINYQIPMPAISTTFGTISREFDIDLSDEVDGVQQNWLESLEHPRIVAFTGMLEYMDYINENNEEVFGIRMRSINCGGEGDGTYIPANTGVLIRAYCDDDATRKEVTTNVASPEGFYYRIGEKNITPDLGYNIMACVTETSKTISPTEDGTYTNYIISKGKYYALDGNVTIPAHKSYMHINTGSATGSAKGIKLLFGDDEEASIRPVQTVSAESNAIFDIYGRRLNEAPKSGLYIINGKKTYKR